MEHDQPAGILRAVRGGEVFTLRGPLSRASLRLGVLRLPSTSARLAWLLAHLDELPGSGIIYALTIGAAEDTARALTEAGHPVAAYTGRTNAAEREELGIAMGAGGVGKATAQLAQLTEFSATLPTNCKKSSYASPRQKKVV